MQCQGYTTNSNKCSRKAEKGFTFCWQHRKIQEEKQIIALNQKILVRNEIAPEIKSTVVNKLGDAIINKIAEYAPLPEEINSVFSIGLVQKEKHVRKFFDFDQHLKINNQDISILYSLSKLKKIRPINIVEAVSKGVRLMEFYNTYFQAMPFNEVTDFMLLLYQSKNIDMFMKLTISFMDKIVEYYNMHSIPGLDKFARENDIVSYHTKLVLNLIKLELGEAEDRNRARDISIDYNERCLWEIKMSQYTTKHKKCSSNNNSLDIDTTKILSDQKKKEYEKLSKKYRMLYNQYFSPLIQLNCYYLTDITYSESIVRYMEIHPDKVHYASSFSYLYYTKDANWLQFLYNTLKLPVGHSMITEYLKWLETNMYFKSYSCIKITCTNLDFFSWVDAILQPYDREFVIIIKDHILKSVKENSPQIYEIVKSILQLFDL